MNYIPKKVVVDGNKVIGIELINNETQETETLEIDGIFVAIGRTPNTAFLGDNIELDKNGYILTKGKSSATNIPGIFRCWRCSR